MSNATAPRARTWTVAEDGCWVWNHAISSGGYGVFTEARRNHYAHRWMYEQHVGPIPDGYHVDHLCRNRACCNPAHLEPVTPAENARRGRAARTHCSRGHEITPENTTGGIQNLCKRCARWRARQRRQAVAQRKVYGTLLWWAVMFRDGCICAYCGNVADTVDHVTPIALGGADVAENLVAACRSCNSRKGTQERAVSVRPMIAAHMDLARLARKAHRTVPIDVSVRDLTAAVARDAEERRARGAVAAQLSGGGAFHVIADGYPACGWKGQAADMTTAVDVKVAARRCQRFGCRTSWPRHEVMG